MKRQVILGIVAAFLVGVMLGAYVLPLSGFGMQGFTKINISGTGEKKEEKKDFDGKKLNEKAEKKLNEKKDGKKLDEKADGKKAEEKII